MTDQNNSQSRQWPLVTINILAYNRKAEVRETLRQLRDLDYPRDRLEIIVVDNASNDDTKAMVADEFPDVRLVVIRRNRGIAGWNEGFKAGNGDYFLVLDDDSAPEDGAGLKAAIEYLEEQRDIGILACRITGGLFSTDTLRDKREWIGFIGCGAIIRKEVVEAIGGYADWIYLYSHEWEYGIRCLDSGFRIQYFAGCVIRHRTSAVNRSSRRTVVYTTRNEMLIVYKYFPRRRIVFLLRTLASHLYLGKIKRFLWVLEGFLMFVRDARKNGKTFVKPEVQKMYADTFWSAQPILGRVLGKLKNAGHSFAGGD